MAKSGRHFEEHLSEDFQSLLDVINTAVADIRDKSSDDLISGSECDSTNYLLEVLLVMHILKCKLSRIVENQNAYDMETLMKYVHDAKTLLTQQNWNDNIVDYHLNLNSIRQEWHRYDKVLRENLQQLDNMLGSLSQCKDLVFAAVWNACSKAWCEIVAKAAGTAPLRDMMKDLKIVVPKQ